MFILEIHSDYSRLIGRITNRTNVLEYLSSHLSSLKLGKIGNKLSKFSKIALIQSVYVDDEKRGRGEGKKIVNNFIERAYELGVESILLVADVHEEQVEDFDLVAWYKKLGFKIIGTSSTGPVMLKRLE